MDWDWTALGKAVRSRRDALRLTQEKLGELAGIHPGTVKNYEAGARSYDKIPKSAFQIAEAIGWTAASVQAVLEGGEPTLVPTTSSKPELPVDAPTPLPPLADRLPKRFKMALDHGEIVDVDMWDLTVGEGTRMITILLADPDSGPRNPEELRRTMREWERAKRLQRGLKPLAWEPGDPDEWKPESET